MITGESPWKNYSGDAFCDVLSNKVHDAIDLKQLLMDPSAAPLAEKMTVSPLRISVEIPRPT